MMHLDVSTLAEKEKSAVMGLKGTEMMKRQNGNSIAMSCGGSILYSKYQTQNKLLLKKLTKTFKKILLQRP